MKKSYIYNFIFMLACIILHGSADDSEEGLGTDDSSEEEAPVQDSNCPTYCPPNPPATWTVCGSNDLTYNSLCSFRQHACAVGATGRWYIKHLGACLRRLPTTRRPPPTVRITAAPTTTRKATTRRVTTTRATTTTTTRAPTTTATPTPTPCPQTCDLVFEPVCTTVGTYQNECTFNWVRCQGIISQSEVVLYTGFCVNPTTTGP